MSNTTTNTTMTPRQADKLITSGNPVMIQGPTGKIATEVIVWRDRYCIRCESGKLYLRRWLRIVWNRG